MTLQPSESANNFPSTDSKHYPLSQNRLLIIELKGRLEIMVDLVDKTIRKGIEDLESEFTQAFQSQMKIIEKMFEAFQYKMQRQNRESEQVKKHDKIIQERGVFMKHSLFLHEQNKKLAHRLREANFCRCTE